MPSLRFIELNEVNFDQVRRYADLGELPNLSRLIQRHGVTETSSEHEYDHLEPWIQWVTAHTGQTFGEHGVYRLGDIVDREIPQIWETLEAQDFTVGAVSPMNANNRCRAPAFFIPDPWTQTKVDAPPLAKSLYAAICQAVNDNASTKLTLPSVAALALGMAVYARPTNYLTYLSLVFRSATGKPWSKALLLDLLLTDVFVRLAQSRSPNFATLFLNAGAHIQHHYMFNSKVYEGPHQNPAWYAPVSADPVLDVYRLYDALVGQVLKAFPDSQLMIGTGLHQDPHDEVTFYWRLKDHAEFLNRIGAKFSRVEPRMSRDFVVIHDTSEQARATEQRLAGVKMADGTPLFDIDNRGDSLFVTLSWPHDILDRSQYLVDNVAHADLRNEVSFVAIKNGKHNAVGYLLDTSLTAQETPARMPLAELPNRIVRLLGAVWPPRSAPYAV